MPLRLLPLAVGPAILLPLAVYAFQHRRVRGALWYSVLLLAIAVWSAAYAWELAAPDFDDKLLALRLKYVGVIALPVAWIGFVLDFVARERAVVRRATSRLGIVAGLILLTAWTNEWHELFWGRLTLDPTGTLYTFGARGPGFYLNVTYTYCVLLAGLAILVAQAIQSPYLYRKRTVILALAVVLPWLGNVIFVARRETAGSIDATPFLFTCTAVIAAVAVFRYRVLEPIPTLLDARIEVIGDGCLMVDRSLRIADLNRAAEAIIRRDRAAAAGEPIESVLRDWPAKIDTEVRQDLTLVAPEGPRTYDVRITPIQSGSERATGYVVLLRDVTEHRQAEAALRDSELRYRGVVENARDLICTCDLDGRILAINQAGLDLTGHARQELFGRKLFDPGSAEAAVVTRDGRTIVLELASWPEYRDNVPIAIQAIGRDVTERRRLEEELRQAQKMESVGKLAGGIAHDFNNLLTAIIGYAALAEAEQVPGTPLHEWIEQIRRSGEQAATLTSQLLAFGRRQVLRPVDLDLNAVVDDIQKMLRRLIGEQIELVVQLAPDLPRVRADRSQVEQVIVNLVVNARDAMSRGGRLTIRTHDATPPGAFAALTVDDTGEGIAPEILERIFEPFFTTKPAGRGTGLGLSMVYGIVKQSGGWIWVYSEPGQGTVFKIYFPPGPGSVARLGAGGSSPSRSAYVARGVVLVVEDEADVRGLTVKMLSRAGYTVLEAASGEEALVVSAGHVGRIDLLVADVVLPGLSGCDTATRLVASRPDLRTLYTSGYTDAVIAERGVLAPESAFLAKPFTADSLLAAVEQVMTL